MTSTVRSTTQLVHCREEAKTPREVFCTRAKGDDFWSLVAMAFIDIDIDTSQKKLRPTRAPSPLTTRQSPQALAQRLEHALIKAFPKMSDLERDDIKIPGPCFPHPPLHADRCVQRASSLCPASDPQYHCCL
jgi:hypothetical protein